MAAKSSLEPHVSIIIRALNEEAYLDLCLKAIAGQRYKNYDIVLLYDKRSTDRTYAIAQSHRIRIVPLEGFNYGRSLNTGCAGAKGPVVVILSAHAVPGNQDWLTELIRPLIGYPKTAASFSRQIPHPDAFNYQKRLYEKNYPVSGRPQVCFSNVSSAFRKQVWSTLHFAETIAEDSQWYRDLTELGYAVQYCPLSVVRHSHHESIRQIIHRTCAIQSAAFRTGRESVTPVFILKKIWYSGMNIIGHFGYVVCRRDSWNHFIKATGYETGYFIGSLESYINAVIHDR